MRAGLPGHEAGETHATVENDTLILHGERKAADEIRRDRYHRLERQAGEFRRSFTLLSLLDTARIGARYEDGVLTITIPPREEALAEADSGAGQLGPAAAGARAAAPRILSRFRLTSGRT